MTPRCLALLTAVAFALPAAAQSSEPLAAPSLERSAFAPTFAVRDLMTEPLVDADADGTVWVRTRTLRSAFRTAGWTVNPVFGPEAAREWPIHLRLASVARGGDELALEAEPSIAHDSTRVVIERAELREVYHLDLDRIEQTFEFDALRGRGDLVIALDVDTELAVEASADQIRFEHSTLGAATYGRAFALDANGRRIAIERTWTGAGIELVVPESFLASAQYPITIDPPVDFFSSNFGIADDGSPDIAFCSRTTDEYMVCWEEYTSSVNSDVYVTTFDLLGNQGGVLAIEMTDANWAKPRIAYSFSADRALVVANVTETMPFLDSVKGRIVDVPTFATFGSAISISALGVPKTGADVGGSGVLTLTTPPFCVVWSADDGDPDIQYRLIGSDGSLMTSITPVTGNTVDHEIQPTISASIGDPAFGDTYWTMAWVRDADGDGYGQIMARRIDFDGDPAGGEGNFVADGLLDNAAPSITSLFDRPIPFLAKRPALVAYMRRGPSDLHAGGVEHDIIVRGVVDGSTLVPNEVSARLEDFDPTLDQKYPAIACDGRGFLLTYQEEKWSDIDGTDYDAFVAAGNIVKQGGDYRVALSERHQTLDSTSDPEYQVSVATLWDGDADELEDDGAAIWLRETSTAQGFGNLDGAYLEQDTLIGTQQLARGVQYCDANPNSIGTFGGRTSTWLWIRGDGIETTTHYAIARDVPPNRFGYLIASLNTGDINMPGNSAGRICIGSPIGRFAAQIANSGPDGVIVTQIDPQLLPQPGMTVAALPGESWHFQLWHRDLDGGGSTSNFSNACRVVFSP